MKIIHRLQATSAPTAVLIIRLMVGAVFLSEGIQKFLYPGDVGAGRFAKIGLPSPEALAPFVASFEIGCGALVILGLLTRVAVVPLIVVMCFALYTTKLPILVNSGFFKMAHEARTDFSMLLGSIFLLIVGSGPWSMDFSCQRKSSPHA